MPATGVLHVRCPRSPLPRCAPSHHPPCPLPYSSAGVLYPFASREDFDFFQHLEMHMRQEHPPLLGRDHLAYRCGLLG